jgi:hypothetical protein
MDIYLSPLYIILAGLCIVLLFSKLHLPAALIAVFSGAVVFYTVYLHVSMYSSEYKTMSNAAWVQSIGPTLLTATVVLMSVGYIIFFFKKNKALTEYKAYVPEEKGATSKPAQWNPFATSSKPQTAASTTSQNQSKNLTKSEEREYISDLDRLI